MKEKIGLGIYFLCLLIVPIFLLPQSSGAFEGSSRPVGTNNDIIEGIELLYNWEFERAENLFHRVVAEKPDDPGGYFYLAMVTWSRLASGFWSPETVKEYGDRIDQVIWVARKRIENEDADSFTYFYLGGALGFKGRFQLMQRKWFSSFLLAVEAIEALKTCHRMDPANKDVLFGLGIFDYYTARMSGVLRFLSFLLLHKGNKAEGLRKLHTAAEEAIYSFIEAKSLLLHIYLFLERDHFHKALRIAEELSARFPRNPRYKFLLGVSYIRLGMDSKYMEVVDFFYKKTQEVTSRGKGAIWRSRALYLEACYHLFHDQYNMARFRLETVLSRADASIDPAMSAWPLLKTGMSYDLEGKREQASRYYKRILSMENGAGAQFLAEKYMDEPAKRGDPFLGY